MIRLIVEIEGGCVVSVYTTAPQDFEIQVLDRDIGTVDSEAERENKRLDTVLSDPNWREIY